MNTVNVREGQKAYLFDLVKSELIILDKECSKQYPESGIYGYPRSDRTIYSVPENSSTLVDLSYLPLDLSAIAYGTVMYIIRGSLSINVAFISVCNLGKYLTYENDKFTMNPPQDDKYVFAFPMTMIDDYEGTIRAAELSVKIQSIHSVCPIPMVDLVNVIRRKYRPKNMSKVIYDEGNVPIIATKCHGVLGWRIISIDDRPALLMLNKEGYPCDIAYPTKPEAANNVSITWPGDGEPFVTEHVSSIMEPALRPNPPSVCDGYRTIPLHRLRYGGQPIQNRDDPSLIAGLYLDDDYIYLMNVNGEVRYVCREDYPKFLHSDKIEITDYVWLQSTVL